MVFIALEKAYDGGAVCVGENEVAKAHDVIKDMYDGATLGSTTIRSPADKQANFQL